MCDAELVRLAGRHAALDLVMLRANLINVDHNVLFGRASALELSIAERRYHARRDELLREPQAAPTTARR